MDLRGYEQHKFAIAEVLRSASSSVPAEERNWHERAQELFARLAEDRFNLVVVGRFNRGKTSLMNAIMGTDRLPMGIVPLTSVITKVAYGSRERVELHYDGRILTSEIPIADLPKYVTQEGNPGNVQRIKKAEVQLPAEILRRGFYFVDTPGLGSAIAENTLTTEAFLPEADAFLLVTSYESPLSDEELRFFRAASASGRRIFVVLNKHDTVSDDERRAVLAYVNGQLSAIFGVESPCIFSVSARDGLDSKRLKDAIRLEASGLPALEGELLDFLLAGKSADFIFGMRARVARLIRSQPSSPDRIQLEEKIRTLSGSVTEENLHAKLPGRSATEPAENENIQQLRSCEICASVNKAVWDFLRRFQYDLAVDEEEQRRFAERGGLCSFHAWQYEAIAMLKGTCTGFPPLIDHVAEQLRGIASSGRILPEIEELGSNSDLCAMCAVQDEAERKTISSIARGLTKDPRTLKALSAICLPHLAVLAAAIENRALARELVKREAMILERISEDMKRYALKRDAFRRQLLTEEEEAAAKRALLILSGHRNVKVTCRAKISHDMSETGGLNDSTSGDGLEQCAGERQANTS
jgi:GTP-binding protein EngB required for normal cell division